MRERIIVQKQEAPLDTNRTRCAARKIACLAAAVMASFCILTGCSAAPANTANNATSAPASNAVNATVSNANADDAATQATENVVTEYTLYIGTNSQDGSDAAMSYADAKQLAIDLALKYVGAYTIYDAQGGWTNGEGVVESENSIVLVLVTDNDAAVRTIADEAAKALNQEAILIQSDRVVSEYYASK